MNGISIYICIGKYAGFRIVWDSGVRIVIGWLALAIVFCDIEQTMKIIYRRNLELEKQRYQLEEK